MQRPSSTTPGAPSPSINPAWNHQDVSNGHWNSGGYANSPEYHHFQGPTFYNNNNSVPYQGYQNQYYQSQYYNYYQYYPQQSMTPAAHQLPGSVAYPQASRSKQQRYQQQRQELTRNVPPNPPESAAKVGAIQPELQAAKSPMVVTFRLPAGVPTPTRTSNPTKPSASPSVVTPSAPVVPDTLLPDAKRRKLSDKTNEERSKDFSRSSPNRRSTPASQSIVTPYLRKKLLEVKDDGGRQLDQINEESERADAEKFLMEQGGDIQRAATHIGRALAKNPSRVDLAEILFQQLQTKPNSILIPQPQQQWHRTALQSYIIGRRGIISDAIVFLTLAFCEYSRVPYFEWVFNQWKCSQPALEEAANKVNMDVIVLALQSIYKRYSQVQKMDIPVMNSLKWFCKFVDFVFKQRKGQFDPQTVYLLGTAFRKAGELDRALEIFTELQAKTPSWKSCVAIGYTLRELGHYEEAIDWLERAGEFKDATTGYLLDAADACLKINDVLRARDNYHKMQKLEPENVWALASIQYIDFLMHGTDEYFAALLKTSFKDNKRARFLVREALDVFKQYRIFLPDPCDCFISAMNELKKYQFVPESQGKDEKTMAIQSAPTASQSGEGAAGLKELVGTFADLQKCKNYPLPINKSVQKEVNVALNESRQQAPLKSNEVRVAVSALEAPSYVNVWKWLNKIYKMNLEFEVEVVGPLVDSAGVDARKPIEAVAFEIWKYPGDSNAVKPVPAVPRPRLADVLNLIVPISEIAKREFDVNQWFQTAQLIDKNDIVFPMNDFDETTVQKLFGLMLHVQEFFRLPDTWGVPTGARHSMLKDTGKSHPPVWSWIYSIYVVIGLIIAATFPSNLEKKDIFQWQGSLQYKALHSMLMGPIDWTVDAAIIAFSRLALDPASPSFVESEVLQLFMHRATKTPNNGYVCYRRALLCHLIMLPSVNPEQRLVWVKAVKKMI